MKIKNLFNLFKRKKKESDTKLPENMDFYLIRKYRRNIKRRRWLSNTIVLVLVSMILISFSKSFKEDVNTESVSTEYAVTEYLQYYYQLTQDETSREYLSTFGKESFFKFSDDVEQFDIKSITLKDIQQNTSLKTLDSDYYVLVEASIKHKDSDVESITFERKVSVKESLNRDRFYVDKISAVSSVHKGFEDEFKQEFIYEAETLKIHLTEDEKKTAETRITLFITQLNESFEGAVELTSGNAVIEPLSEDTQYEFVRLINASKNDKDTVWSLQIEIKEKSGFSEELKNVDITYNAETSRIEKWRIY